MPGRGQRAQNDVGALESVGSEDIHQLGKIGFFFGSRDVTVLQLANLVADRCVPFGIRIRVRRLDKPANLEYRVAEGRFVNSEAGVSQVMRCGVRSFPHRDKSSGRLELCDRWVDRLLVEHRRFGVGSFTSRVLGRFHENLLIRRCGLHTDDKWWGRRRVFTFGEDDGADGCFDGLGDVVEDLVDRGRDHDPMVTRRGSDLALRSKGLGIPGHMCVCHIYTAAPYYHFNCLFWDTRPTEAKHESTIGFTRAGWILEDVVLIGEIVEQLDGDDSMNPK